jgi:hypothetical protein
MMMSSRHKPTYVTGGHMEADLAPPLHELHGMHNNNGHHGFLHVQHYYCILCPWTGHLLCFTPHQQPVTVHMLQACKVSLRSTARLANPAAQRARQQQVPQV